MIEVVYHFCDWCYVEGKVVHCSCEYCEAEEICCFCDGKGFKEQSAESHKIQQSKKEKFEKLPQKVKERIWKRRKVNEEKAWKDYEKKLSEVFETTWNNHTADYAKVFNINDKK